MGVGNLAVVAGIVLLVSVEVGGALQLPVLSGVVDNGGCILVNSSLFRVCGWLAHVGLSIGCLELGLGLTPPVSRLCKAGIVQTVVDGMFLAS